MPVHMHAHPKPIPNLRTQVHSSGTIGFLSSQVQLCMNWDIGWITTCNGFEVKEGTLGTFPAIV